MRRVALAVTIVALVLATSLTGVAKPCDFAITYVRMLDGKTTITRVYVQGDTKERTELDFALTEPTAAGERLRRVTNIEVIRKDLGKAWRLDAVRRICFEAPLDELEYSREPRFKQLPKIGQETILGHVCDVYWDEMSYTGYPEKTWYAPDLGIVLRTVSGEGDDMAVMEAIELKIGEQPDSLFEMPADYRKTTLDELLQREITLADIDDALFSQANWVLVSALAARKGYVRLDPEEIAELRTCLRSCTELAETSKTADRLTVDAIISLGSGTMYYDAKAGTLLVNKMDVNGDRYDEYSMHWDLMAKYLRGAYEFKATPQFTTFIEKVLNRAASFGSPGK